MEKSFNYCNKCGKEDNCAMIHCAVCSYPFHAKCVAPKLTVKACDELVIHPNFNFYCDEHLNYCVHKLLNRISSLEKKFRKCAGPLKEITDELDNHQVQLFESGYNKPIIAEKPTCSADLPVSIQPNHGRVEANTSPSSSFSQVEPSAPFTISSNITLRRSNLKRGNNETIKQISPKRPRTGTILMDIEESPTGNSNNTNVMDNQALQLQLPQQPANSENIPTLRCVKPQRAIFLSGLDPETTTEDIIVYANHKAREPLEISIRKMKFNVQARSAVFVIYVGTDENMFHKLCDSSFWPDRIHCREYDFFRQRPERFQKKPPMHYHLE